ncbi:hypothetical protein [Yoonia sp. BS5-3]|uniref:Uncharacterized protein n=1 Tax=Yoonia phaeophyticola TaxID=3137369 RepID=A0ABZ2V068_9RHOB
MMILGGSGRVLALALLLFIGGMQSALAHALPGSVLFLSHDQGQMNVTILLPIEDLVIAAPALKALEDLDGGQDITPAQQTQIGAYFAAHLKLQTEDGVIALELIEATIKTAGNAEVGTYNELTIQLTGTSAADMPLFPMRLSYDAVMHEVRNHRATVYWKDPTGMVSGVAEFGYRRIGGKVQPVLITRP